jgi:hypothetical protein
MALPTADELAAEAYAHDKRPNEALAIVYGEWVDVVEREVKAMRRDMRRGLCTPEFVENRKVYLRGELERVYQQAKAQLDRAEEVTQRYDYDGRDVLRAFGEARRAE